MEEIGSGGDRPDECADALTALRDGRIDDWHGLPAACTRADAEQYLGPSAAGPDGTGQLGGMYALFRNYPVSDHLPFGIQVWFDEYEKVVLLQITEPAFGDIREQIGEPEAVLRSRLAHYHDQLVYAGRGLALHVDRADGAITRLYAFEATTTEAFEESWLSEVANERRRL